MESIYRFSINGYKVNPIFDSGLTKEYSPETNEIFMRSSLTGKVKLNNSDFDWLKSFPMQTEFIILVEMLYNDIWSEYWKGKFFKTDCSFDDDNRICELKFQINDQYSKILSGYDKEFNLIKLAPARTLLDIIKRPLIQFYIPGDNVVSCFMAGSYWEQDVLESVDDAKKIKDKYYFALASTVRKFNITADDPALAQYAGDYTSKSSGLWIEKTETYKITENKHSVLIEIPGFPERNYYAMLYYYKLIKISDGSVIFTSDDVRSSIINGQGVKLKNAGIGFNKNVGVGYLSGFSFEMEIYMRYLLDVETFLELPTFLLPLDDFVSNNRNYKRAINYSVDLVTVSLETQAEPTEFGLADNGQYFKIPVKGGGKYYPIARSTWGLSSIWLNFSGINEAFEDKAFKQYTLKDSSLLSDVIKVLLAQIDPSLTHEATDEFSSFLYGEENPVSFNSFRLMITQKSNVLAGEYDRPAQKAIITLNQVFKMLKNAYKVFWFVEDSKLKFEHISFFKNGRSYTQTPELNVDLTRLIDSRNKKPFAYNTSKYSFDKETLPETMEFGWMDETTVGFKGSPIIVNSKFVQLGKIETTTVEQFTSDIDLMLVNPAAFSQDGFALFAAIYNETSSKYELPFYSIVIDGARLRLQNGFASFVYLHLNFWRHDLPSYDVEINGEQTRALGITRTKTQPIKYPSLQDPDPLKLIKTYLGNGQINKLSINLSSRQNQINLIYDTE